MIRKLRVDPMAVLTVINLTILVVHIAAFVIFPAYRHFCLDKIEVFNMIWAWLF